MKYKEVLDPPAGMGDDKAHWNICRHCRARVNPVGRTCNECGSTELANCGGFYRQGNKLGKLK